MQKTEELLLNSFREMWLKYVNVKWNCVQNPCVHAYIYVHIHILKSTSVYLKKYICKYASIYSSIDTLHIALYGCKCARCMRLKRQDQ